MWSSLRRRFPSRAESWPVLAVFLFLVNSWALYRLFWYLPSWLEYLSLGRVLVIAAYTSGFSLLESLSAWAVLLLIAAVLPPAWFKEQFTSQGAVVALATGLGAFLVQRRVSMILDWNSEQVYLFTGLSLGALFVGLLLAGWLLRRLPRLHSIVSSIIERMTIFGYIYFPLGMISLAWVIARNLLPLGGIR